MWHLCTFKSIEATCVSFYSSCLNCSSGLKHVLIDKLSLSLTLLSAYIFNLLICSTNPLKLIASLPDCNDMKTSFRWLFLGNLLRFRKPRKQQEAEGGCRRCCLPPSWVAHAHLLPRYHSLSLSFFFSLARQTETQRGRDREATTRRPFSGRVNCQQQQIEAQVKTVNYFK